ncbi:GcrA family cell cycle regulator, partial [Brevundimonas diminuta]
MNPGWTEDRVGALKKLWLEGQSASQIAKALGGGVTRNAVIGK